ncbi:MAG: hypothetical protein V3R82_07225 [Candidatus Hydrothermarchaeales archaeon]
MKRRRANDISHLSQEEVDELVERFVKEKGWYVPANMRRTFAQISEKVGLDLYC